MKTGSKIEKYLQSSIYSVLLFKENFFFIRFYFTFATSFIFNQNKQWHNYL